jgi:hypothetical protein
MSKSVSDLSTPLFPTAPPSTETTGILKVTTRSITLDSTRKRAIIIRTLSATVELNLGTSWTPLRTIAGGVLSPTLSLGISKIPSISANCAELSWAAESKWSLTYD